MKFLKPIAIGFVLMVAQPLTSFAQFSTPRMVTLDQVVERVSSENYSVYANALRVYQSRESIEVARMNLLPRLNLWNVAGAAFEIVLGGPSGIATGIAGVIGDIAPFLIPANWARVSQAERLYLADQEGYRALWANELMSAKAIYVHLLLDRSLLEHIEQSRQELNEILGIVRLRETFGGADQGATRDIEVRKLALEEDQRSLEVLIEEEESLLAYLMGYSADSRLTPAGLEMPDFEALQPLNYADFEFRVTDTAPEMRQYEYFLQAASFLDAEVMYSFLGTSNMSRGVAGGIFDGIPMQNGLGFGAPASMRIISAQREILRTQRRGIEETIKRQLRLLVSNYNLDLENYANLKRREELTKQTLDQLFERLRLGQSVATLDLIEASRNHIQADTAYFAVKFRFLSSEDRLARLIFHGDYTRQPLAITALERGRAR